MNTKEKNQTQTSISDFSPKKTLCHPKSHPPQKTPKNWPPEILYRTAPTYSKTLSSQHLTSLKTPPKDTLLIPTSAAKGPSPVVKITPITTPSHPACGQSGLFAASDLKPGQFILQYLGIIHASPNSNSNSPDSEGVHDSHADSNYDLSLDRELRIGIDADRMGNEARFINDYRGVAERANAEFRECWDERRGERGMG
ncbi:hypothetical protein LOCC1_G006879, partial [Lachnellula occidentalis]